MQKLTSLVAAFLMLLGATDMFAQGLTVKGRVIDESGEPLVAVTVFEDGKTTNGTLTGLDGNYSLTVSSAKAALQTKAEESIANNVLLILIMLLV